MLGIYLEPIILYGNDGMLSMDCPKFIMSYVIWKEEFDELLKYWAIYGRILEYMWNAYPFLSWSSSLCWLYWGQTIEDAVPMSLLPPIICLISYFML
jgi:hypothetical protein